MDTASADDHKMTTGAMIIAVVHGEISFDSDGDHDLTVDSDSCPILPYLGLGVHSSRDGIMNSAGWANYHIDECVLLLY